MNQRYPDYLRSTRWKTKRRRALERAGNKCEICPNPSESAVLHCHHYNYKRIGKESARDLFILCEDCHTEYHKRRKRGTLPKDTWPRIRRLESLKTEIRGYAYEPQFLSDALDASVTRHDHSQNTGKSNTATLTRSMNGRSCRGTAKVERDPIVTERRSP